MQIEQHYCYTNSKGENIYLFTLRNDQGTEVKITNYGATITAFKLWPGQPGENDIVLGFDRMEDYLSPAYLAQYPWFGCAVGRYANRIDHAAFKLDGKSYRLTQNNGVHQLHGGIRGFDRRNWELVDSGNSPQSFLELRLLSPDGEEGYPGNLNVHIRFELSNENELIHTYTATTDQPTPCNLTHHSYFNLNNGDGDIMEHELRIPASFTIDQDVTLVATGETSAVEGTAYDLRQFRKVKEGLDSIPEYDKSFILDRKEVDDQPVAELRVSKILLQVYSSEPIVHFYSGKWTPQVIGKNGQPYGPWSGLCLETHGYPNAVNIPHFPDTILRPGKTYRQRTKYRVVQL